MTCRQTSHVIIFLSHVMISFEDHVCSFPQPTFQISNGRFTTLVILIVRLLAQTLPSILIQDRALSTIKKYLTSFSAWQKWAEARDIKALPTSGPEFSLYMYLLHLQQSTRSLASIKAVTFGVVWAHQKACLPSPSQHTMVKQLLEACKRILGT